MNFESSDIELDVATLSAHLKSAFSYWLAIKEQRTQPLWSDVDMMALPLEVLPWCSVMDVMLGADDFRVRFWGTERSRLQGSDYTGKLVSEFYPSQVSKKVLNESKKVVEQQRPLLFETKLFSDDLQSSISYKMLRLPFGNAENVDIIMSVPEFPQNTKSIYEWLGTEVPISVLRNND
jgi:hypothetical protein